MFITLEEAKAYLKVDSEDENQIISDSIHVAEELTLNILRCQESDFETVPETVKQAALYCIASLYENREGGNIKAVMDIMKMLLFAYRKDAW